MFEDWDFIAEISESNSFGEECSLAHNICYEQARNLPEAYIVSGEDIFIVSDEALLETRKEISDGSKVIFQTPKKQPGKKRWAYKIRPNNLH